MTEKNAYFYKTSIFSSGKSIYSHIDIGDANYWIPTQHLETLLNEGLQGLSLAGLALRTRSKFVKLEVCKSLGYPSPGTFKKTQPRFFGQQLDVYTQKSYNLQIWNEELSPTRRYAIIQINNEDIISKVKVINGQELAKLDTTGTITTKYQASLGTSVNSHELLSYQDTPPIFHHTQSNINFSPDISPIHEPESGQLLPISEVFERLSPLVGLSFKDPGIIQERNRGEALHRLVCDSLGYSSYEDRGQFPDVRHQLLEVKLQTSPTIDLGLVTPDSEAPIDIKQVGNFHPRHCDARYAIFFASTDGETVQITNLIVTTGSDFFSRFRRFEGRVTNGKLQIPLPKDFF